MDVAASIFNKSLEFGSYYLELLKAIKVSSRLQFQKYLGNYLSRQQAISLILVTVKDINVLKEKVETS